MIKIPRSHAHQGAAAGVGDDAAAGDGEANVIVFVFFFRHRRCGRGGRKVLSLFWRVRFLGKVQKGVQREETEQGFPALRQALGDGGMTGGVFWDLFWPDFKSDLAFQVSRAMDQNQSFSFWFRNTN